MGTSGYKEKKHIEYANIPEELKNIRNNHYSCLDCNLMPEIININDKTGMIELNCTKHNKKELKIENYLKNQFSNFHYENDNNNDNFNRNQLNYSNESRIIENNDRNNLMDKMKIIENKRNRLIRIKEFNENYIKLLDIILEIYEKKPLNYMNNINIKNIAKIINSENSEEVLLEKINNLETKILNYLNVKLKLEVKLTGKEIKINLNGKNIGNLELFLLNAIEFKNLEELEAKNNNITSIEPILEFKAPKLKKVYLRYNSIYNINNINDMKDKFKDLKIIDLRNNKIIDNKIYSNEFKIILDNNSIMNEIKDIKRVINGQLNNIIIFKLKYKLKNGKTRIFGNKFFKNNKNNCEIYINSRRVKFNDFFDHFQNEEKYIKIILNSNVNSLEDMFLDCNTLISLEDISKSKNHTNNITNMINLFKGCSSLIYIKNISNWDTSNVTNMKNMFYGCEKLLPLDDISKWNTSKVEDISGMFYGCKSLLFLPEISKWNISNITNISDIFNGCSELKKLPDLSKWDTSKVEYMHGIFFNCKSLSFLPDISKWKTSKVKNMHSMFYKCSLLEKLPDISKWDTSNVEDMSSMFKECSSLKKAPPISKWNTSKIQDKKNIYF